MVGGEPHASRALFPGKGLRYPLNKEQGGSQSRYGSIRENVLAPAGIRTLERLASSLGNVPTELPRLSVSLSLSLSCFSCCCMFFGSEIALEVGLAIPYIVK